MSEGHYLNLKKKVVLYYEIRVTIKQKKKRGNMRNRLIKFVFFFQKQQQQQQLTTLISSILKFFKTILVNFFSLV